jgi:hypothetical protein
MSAMIYMYIFFIYIISSGVVFSGSPRSNKRVTIENADAQIYFQNPGERFSVGTSSFLITNTAMVYIFF